MSLCGDTRVPLPVRDGSTNVGRLHPAADRCHPEPSDGLNTSVLYRDSESAPFTTIVKTDYKTQVAPLFFTADDQRLYALSNRGRDKTALVIIDPKRPDAEQTIYERPDVDLSGANWSRVRRVLTYADFVTDRTGRKFFDPQAEALFGRIEAKLPGYEIVLQSQTRDEDKFIVAATNDKTPGARYVYDAKSDTLAKMAEINPWIPDGDMAPMKPISYRSRDGLTIHGCIGRTDELTLQTGARLSLNRPFVFGGLGAPATSVQARTSGGQVDAYPGPSIAIMISHPPTSLTGIHLMAKPIGPLCNLDCGYCFYLEKESLFPAGKRFRMSDDVLDAYVKGYIAATPASEVEFTWQGGEPTLVGKAFFERAVALQRRHANGKVIRNTLQTNGTLLDDEWGAFLKREGFLVGVSLDGTRALNDVARPDKRGRSSYDDTVRGLQVLSKHCVDFNVLVTVSSANVNHPLDVYRHLKELGARFIQFNPVVERAPVPKEVVIGLHFATPPVLSRVAAQKVAPQIEVDVPVTSHSVGALAYGEFLNAVFDEWVRHDVGTVHVMNFEWALASWCQLAPGACIFSPRCGKAAIVEHDGSVYSCDHFMYPEYRLGNVMTDDPAVLMDSPAQRAFGDAKETTLPGECLRCEFRFACNGECPKNRFIKTADGEAGLNYLCAGYKTYFAHITPAMNTMARLLAEGKPADGVMQQLGH